MKNQIQRVKIILVIGFTLLAIFFSLGVVWSLTYIFKHILHVPDDVLEYQVLIASIVASTTAFTIAIIGWVYWPSADKGGGQNGNAGDHQEENEQLTTMDDGNRVKTFNPAEWLELKQKVTGQHIKIMKSAIKRKTEKYNNDISDKNKVIARYSLIKCTFLCALLLSIWNILSGLAGQLVLYLAQTDSISISDSNPFVIYAHTALLTVGSLVIGAGVCKAHRRRCEFVSINSFFLIGGLGALASAAIMYLQMTPEMISFINDTKKITDSSGILINDTEQIMDSSRPLNVTNASLVYYPWPISGRAPMLVVVAVQKIYMIAAASLGGIIYGIYCRAKR